jgi:hypothetical protein
MRKRVSRALMQSKSANRSSVDFRPSVSCQLLTFPPKSQCVYTRREESRPSGHDGCERTRAPVMRADIRHGPQHNTLAGYINARAQSTRLTKPVAPRGRTIHQGQRRWWLPAEDQSAPHVITDVPAISNFFSAPLARTRKAWRERKSGKGAAVAMSGAEIRVMRCPCLCRKDALARSKNFTPPRK